MRHRKRKFGLNRFTSWRKATLNSMCRNLLIHQSIKTTKIKAKAAKMLAERLITMGKKGDLASRRRAFAILQDHKLVTSLFTEIAPRFMTRKGGYCRILPLNFRRGDGAQVVVLEFTEKTEKRKKAVKHEKTLQKPKEEISRTPVESSRPHKERKPKQKFLGGLRKIFKKERDAI
ncbi:MAG: 50S ribosomal protein L17 [Candidatus Omnitrophota bacterium]